MDLYKREADISNEQIAATIAHEIKNPLQLIKATLQYMQLGDTKQAYKQKYELIYREIDRLCEMLASYMQAASANNILLEDVSIGEVINDVEELFSKSGTSITFKITPFVNQSNILGELIINGNYNKIKQALINLIKNALEAIECNPKGKIFVYSYRKGANIVISVKDNGCGISESGVNSILTPFYTTKKEGTGLGLSITNEIIKSHNGSLNFKSREGKGTTATITIPAK